MPIAGVDYSAGEDYSYAGKIELQPTHPQPSDTGYGEMALKLIG
jgi:hypothetical protein